MVPGLISCAYSRQIALAVAHTNSPPMNIFIFIAAWGGAMHTLSARRDEHKYVHKARRDERNAVRGETKAMRETHVSSPRGGVRLQEGLPTNPPPEHAGSDGLRVDGTSLAAHQPPPTGALQAPTGAGVDGTYAGP